MKRPFEKQDRIASASSIENLQALLVKAYYGSNIKITATEGGWQVSNSRGPMDSVGIFWETTHRGQYRFWAYFKSEAKS